ncbi:MAG: carbohydrate ABC transporter permease [Proteobacteria bacterium]|nr:carbohydrate ABC transporter permease [Pseudomonadota bacterium]
MRWAVTFIALAIIITPGLWIVINSFRFNVEIMAKPAVWIPKELTLDHYFAMFGSIGEGGVPVFSYFKNSLIISVTSTLITLAIAVMAGYVFARFRFKFKNTYFVGFMLTRTIPGVALSLPLFIVFARVGFLDSYTGMILTYTAMNLPFSIWLIDGFFRQIPIDLLEVAQIDGCTRWQAFWNVEFPLAKSGIASAGIFAFLTAWNEFALASQLTRSVNAKTLPVGLLDFTSQFTINWGGMCALAVIMIVPALLLTYLVQKHLVAGLTFGSVKG